MEFSLNNVEKTIGCMMCSLKNVEKQMVLWCVRSKMLKNQWFYIGFTVKPVPSTDSGREFAILVWRSYEEPLQTSCLGNHWFYDVFDQKY